MSIQTSDRSVSLARRLLLPLLIICGVGFALVAGYGAFLSTSLALPKSDEHPPLLIYGALYSTFTFQSLFLQGVLGYSAPASAIVGLPDILNAVLYSLIVGGIAAVAFALYHRAFRRMSANVMDIVQSMAFAVVVGGRPTPALSGRASIGKLPYGVSIAAGTIAWLGARLFGLA